MGDNMHIEFDPEQQATAYFNRIKRDLASQAMTLGDIKNKVTMQDVTRFMGTYRVLLATVMGTATQERYDFLTRWFDFATAGMQQRQEMEDARGEDGSIYVKGEEVEFALPTMPLGPTRKFQVVSSAQPEGYQDRAYILKALDRNETRTAAEWLLWLHSGSIAYRELRAKMLEELKAVYGR